MHMTLLGISQTIKLHIKQIFTDVFFTSEDRLCTNLRVQKQSTSMTSQCQYPLSRAVIDKLWWSHNAKSEKTALSDNGEICDRLLFLPELKVQNLW